MPEVKRFIDELEQPIKCSLVKIAGAHDENWPLAYSYQTPVPKTVAEKHAHALAMKDEFGWSEKYGQVYVDASSVENGSFQKTFTAWPELYVVFRNGKVSYVGQGSVSTQGAYDMNELFHHIRMRLPSAGDSEDDDEFIFDEYGLGGF